MRASVIHRLQKLEEVYNREPCIVIATDEQGNNVKMPLKEAIEKNYSIGRMISGASAGNDGLCLYLDYMLYWNGIYNTDDYFTDFMKEKVRKLLEKDPKAEEHRRAEIDAYFESDEFKERINGKH